MNKRAVVVGINKYENGSNLPDLEGAENDAREVHAQLTEFGAFEIAKDHFLRGEQATAEKIRQALSDLFYSMDQSDVSLFYFSGHGFEDSYHDGYIAPYDVNCACPRVKGIRMKELQDLLLLSKHKEAALVILDCCYSGKAAVAGVKAGSEVPTKPLEGNFDSAAAGRGRIIYTSSGKDQKSREKTDCIHKMTDETPHAHGIFSYHLLEGLNGGVATDLENGGITLGSLMDYVEGQMDKSTPPSMLSSDSQHARSIVILNQSRISSIQQPLQWVQDMLADEDILTIHGAIQKLSIILAKAPKHPEAKRLREDIGAKISAHRTRCLEFLRGITALMAENHTQRIYQTLKDSTDRLNFETLQKMDSATLDDFSDLTRAAREEIDQEDFLRRLRDRAQAESTKRQNQDALPSPNRAPRVQGPGLGGPGV